MDVQSVLYNHQFYIHGFSQLQSKTIKKTQNNNTTVKKQQIKIQHENYLYSIYIAFGVGVGYHADKDSPPPYLASPLPLSPKAACGQDCSLKNVHATHNEVKNAGS